MNNRVVDIPEVEAKKNYDDIITIEKIMIDNFFDFTYRELPNIYKSNQDYIHNLKKEFRKIKMMEARRLLGLG